MKSFEERLTRLEQISDDIDTGELSLEEAVSRFEEGIRLARGLEKELSKIERRVEILVNQPESPEQSPNLELFAELDDAETVSDPDTGESDG